MKDDLLKPSENLEQLLAVKRQKQYSVFTSLAYRGTAIGKKIFGRKTLLPLFLNSSRLFWRLAFELSGELYGDSFHAQVRVLSEDVLKKWIPKDGSVIDIGCGYGRWCRVAAKYAQRVVGVDYDQTVIEAARERTKAENVEYLVGDVSKELKGQKFDLALLSHVIEHIEESDSLLREVKNIADKIIVEVPDFSSDSLNWVRLKHGFPFYSDGDHVQEYTLETLQNQLERTGWKVLHHEKNNAAVLAVAAGRENTSPSVS